MQTKLFPLRVVLSASTGRLLTEGTPGDNGKSLDALQAAVDWATNPELSFDLTDACRLNDAISTSMCGGKGDIDTEHKQAEGQ